VALDDDRIAAEISLCRADNRELSDGTARAIASSWHDGSRVALAFVSSGEIANNSSDTWRACGGEEYRARDTDERDRLALDMLGTYLLNRTDRGPIPQWADLWIGDDRTGSLPAAQSQKGPQRPL
jgi:hypothetical protein